MTDIPTKLIKEFCDFFLEFLYKSINHRITDRNFRAGLTEAKVYKNYGKANRSNYRPISILCFKNIPIFQKYDIRFYSQII